MRPSNKYNNSGVKHVTVTLRLQKILNQTVIWSLVFDVKEAELSQKTNTVFVIAQCDSRYK